MHVVVLQTPRGRRILIGPFETIELASQWAADALPPGGAWLVDQLVAPADYLPEQN